APELRMLRAPRPRLPREAAGPAVESDRVGTATAVKELRRHSKTCVSGAAGPGGYTRRVPRPQLRERLGGNDPRQRAEATRMALRLKIAGALGRSLGDRGAMEFGPSGGTIGRSPECSWVLPDTHRYLSSRHASIDFRGGCYYIVDTSTNGVYVNDAEQPVGRGKPQRLFNGDRIRMGEYEMAVEIDDDTIERLIDQHHVEPVPLAQRVEAPSEPTSELVDAYEMTGVGIEMMLTDDELHTLTPPKKRRSAPVPVLELEDDAPDTTRASIEHGAAPPRPQAPQAARPGAAVRAASAAQQRPLATPPTDRSKPNGSSPPPKPNGAAPRTGAAPAKAP